MRLFQLYDAVALRKDVPLTEGGTALEDTAGTIVEVFNNGEAYLVELFGRWGQSRYRGGFVPATPDEPDAFMETLGIETLYPHQLELVKSAQDTMGIRDSGDAIGSSHG